MENTHLSTHHKALQLNSDRKVYGTFAEIGAGQEVVRWFFRVGGASGTVIKSMSAYDMKVSDAIYGKADRYVSKHRLTQMLDYEYRLNQERMIGIDRSLFAFADTIATQNLRGPGDPHGWMGIRFQSSPGAEYSQVIIHLRMIDRDTVTQQEALGIVGVNLIYAAFYLRDNPENFIISLLGELTSERVQIDMIEFSGAGFEKVDNRLKSLYLVKHRLSEVAMFDGSGKVLQPSETIYKKPLLIERGTFRPVTKIHMDILTASRRAFLSDFPEHAENLLVFMEITMENLLDNGEIFPEDFLDRVDILGALGLSVLITHYPSFYRLSTYLSRYTSLPITFAIGGASLEQILNRTEYNELEGGFLEAMSRLFRKNVRAYIYPQMLWDGKVISAESFETKPELCYIYQHLLNMKHIVTIKNESVTHSPFTSKEVIRRIKSKDPTWVDLVPKEVAKMIIQRGLFDYDTFS